MRRTESVPESLQTDPSGEIDRFAARFEQLNESVGSQVTGASTAIHLALVCLLAEGHLLIEDLPGVGKTTLARALADAIGGRSSRIQFTPDLLPSDLLGVHVFHMAREEFEFRPGPVFANVVHADEINRASPKVQSALLEVMQEQQVTTDGESRPVPSPFLVVATQNPVEFDGTYRLPAAQLDRFLIRTGMGSPSLDQEVEMVTRVTAPGGAAGRAAPADPIADLTSIRTMIDTAGAVHTAPEVIAYAASITRATRTSPDVAIGASPRATVGLVRAAKVHAAAQRRDHVVPDDIRFLAQPALAHRIECGTTALLAGRSGATVVDEALDAVPVPSRRRT